MQTRWLLSKFYRNSANILIPVAADYGSNWLCPTSPPTDDGSALVLIHIDPQQVDAAGEDARLVVCPLVFDPAAVPTAVTDVYASWGATAGMSMGALLAKLAATEPIFGTQSF